MTLGLTLKDMVPKIGQPWTPLQNCHNFTFFTPIRTGQKMLKSPREGPWTGQAISRDNLRAYT